jgi:hypothetical protein
VKPPKIRTYSLISAASVFKVTLIVVVLTICGVFFWGLGDHHTFFENGLLSTTILSIAFFLFITSGLYRGVKLKDDLNISDKVGLLDFSTVPDLPSTGKTDIGLDIGDGCAEAIIAAILWFLLAIVLSILLWFFGQIIWLASIAFTAMLYWIFFRALRLVFKNSNRSKGKADGKRAVRTVLYVPV